MPEGELEDYADADKQPKTDEEANAVADGSSREKRQKYPMSICDESHG